MPKHATRRPAARRRTAAPSRVPAVIAAIVVFAFAIAVVFSVFSCSGTSRGSIDPAEMYESPYDWTCLDRTDGRYTYTVDGRVKSRIGIDVSDHNHEIDWDAVADDGIEFAIIRLGYRGATEGNLYVDQFFEANLNGAQAAGIDCGVYFFSQATTVEEARAEADFVLEHLDGMKLEYPVVFDWEPVSLAGGQAARTDGLDSKTLTAIVETFCSRVEQGGYDTIVYGNRRDLGRIDYETLEGHRIWWAEYGSPAPAATIDICMWQYANNGEVDGISNGVDMDIDLSDVLGL